MSKRILTASLGRRAMLGLSARSALSVVVSQSVLGCGASSDLAAAVTDPTDVAGGASSGSCVLTAALTEGPYFVDEKLERSDIRTDPVTGAASTGTALTLQFNVSRVASAACTPLTGAYLDVWHCDAAGVYSDESANGSARRKFLRGYQITDAGGVARFTTIYPGWYSGRAVHTHFKLRLFAGAAKTYEFTSQFFFDEAMTSTVHASAPYNARGTRNTLNSTDGIYNSLSAAQKTALTLLPSRTADGYSGIINLGVNVG